MTGVVVPVGARSCGGQGPPADLHVVNRGQLQRWLGHREHMLEEATIELVYIHARQPSTWQ